MVLTGENGYRDEQNPVCQSNSLRPQEKGKKTMDTSPCLIYVFVVYNLVNSVFLTFMQVPYFSMVSLMTRNGEERGFLGNIQQLFQSIGTILINACFIPLLTLFSDKADNPNTQAGFTGAMIVISIIVTVCTLITVVFTKERVRDDDKSDSKTANEKPWDAIKALIRNK